MCSQLLVPRYGGDYVKMATNQSKTGEMEVPSVACFPEKEPPRELMAFVFRAPFPQLALLRGDTIGADTPLSAKSVAFKVDMFFAFLPGRGG